MNQACVVEYQVGSYHGKVTVSRGEDDTNESIIRRARAIVRCEMGGSFPFGCEHFDIVGGRHA